MNATARSLSTTSSYDQDKRHKFHQGWPERSMATTVCLPAGYIKIEDTPSPGPFHTPIDGTVIDSTPIPVIESAPAPIDPRDPEGFLKRCSGFNKSKRIKERCSAVIGKKSEQSCHPTFLPTCRAHRDQQSFAGWCQYQRIDGERCGRLFRWTPPYFELCSEHQGHPDTPCYYFQLPLELRHEVLRYLLPDRPIGSSTAALHDGKSDVFETQYVHPVPRSGQLWINNYRHHAMMPMPHHHDIPDSVFPTPALDLFLVNRQFYLEAKDLLFSTVPFTIDVRKDGTFMCGRRLLEPRRADGSSHFCGDDADEAKQRFLRHFDWAAVKHYVVDILVENGTSGDVGLGRGVANGWDEEVEVYDIRDYISVVVSGVLSKSRTLAKLQIRLCLADFSWSPTVTLHNAKILFGPFESLRNVRQPQIVGTSTGRPNHNSMLTVQRPVGTRGSWSPICSVPALPTGNAVWVEGLAEYAAKWCKTISTQSDKNLVPKSPIRAMFTSFKEFYSDLANLVREVTYIQGRHAFLHRARVAREHENIEAFRELRNDLIQYWYAYLEREERKKKNMETKLSRMLETDVYPSHEWEEASMRLPPVATDSKTKEPLALSEILDFDSNALLRELGTGLVAQLEKRDGRCGEPGPSTKRRRVDSGFSEITEVDDSPSTIENDNEEVVYVGKGKGRMDAKEVICIE